MLVRSWEKVFCRLMQNLYNSTGTTQIKLQAKALEDIDACGFDVGSAVLILNRHVEDGYNRYRPQTATIKQREKPDGSLHP